MNELSGAAPLANQGGNGVPGGEQSFDDGASPSTSLPRDDRTAVRQACRDRGRPAGCAGAHGGVAVGGPAMPSWPKLLRPQQLTNPLTIAQLW
jgi:hypothetical protein